MHALFPWRRPQRAPGPEEPAPPGADCTDEVLLAAVAAGRVDALRELHRRHAPWLRARLSRRCADPDLVADVVQDTFVAVWRSAGRYRSAGPDAGAWIWTIGVRRLISTLRAARPPFVELGRADDVTQSAEDLVLLGVEHSDVGTAVSGLSPELRAVIQATVLDGLTTREAAQLLGIPEGTVKTRARRARAQLRELLT
ncbi:RNA polymerase sigma factor [Cryptosporangium japonicum]|uniref:RNA polymerase sigma factor n=1 Tax=Cryptosporangium japonicum TaxID=80872 RepID=A0ABN0UKM3_9ACTN